MGQFRLWPARRLKILAPLVIAPLVGVFLWSSEVAGPGIFGTTEAVEASAAMFAPPAKIDGKRAYEYLKKICEIGPRTAGSDANKRQLEMVEAHFIKLGGAVTRQPFVVAHPQTGARLTMTNLIASWHPERNQRVVIGAHYDTRPHPDEEPPNRRNLPFLGANDCASGVALLMEMAHHINGIDTRLGVDLVLFDAEELVFGSDPATKEGEYFLGSKEFARRYAEKVDAGRNNGNYYVAGIVLDMVGGRDLRLPRDPYSMQHAREIVDQVWSVANRLRARSFRNEPGPEVTDDHIALNENGIPTIDIIDFRYRFWHKANDLPEACSAESLEEVGRVLTAWLAAAHPSVTAPVPKRKRR
jgi:glutaminyl-peptide cyclotransferase